MLTTTQEIYACLPFVCLAQEANIQLGPVSFWPASRYKEFIPEESHQAFSTYMESISQIKAKVDDRALINTTRLYPEGTTCISIDRSVPAEKKEALLIDSLYLLYFVCTFRNLYHCDEIPSFIPFRKMIPAEIPFIQSPENWKNLFILENNREETICLHLLDEQLCNGLGNLLNKLYESQQNSSSEQLEAYTRLIHSICYIVDRFYPHFVNLVEKGLFFSKELYKPEDLIFLSSSFEALFDISENQMAADLKHKLRPLLHLTYSIPLEIFWKWIDDFFAVRRKIVRGSPLPDSIFVLNPNFEVSHLLIGLKLFIYSVYYSLYNNDLLKTNEQNTPPKFKSIPLEEILIFFWTETSLLRKIEDYLNQTLTQANKAELYADIHSLTSLYSSLYQDYYLYPIQNGIRFIPSPLSEIEDYVKQILKILEDSPDNPFLIQSLAPHFEASLRKRVSS